MPPSDPSPHIPSLKPLPPFPFAPLASLANARIAQFCPTCGSSLYTELEIMPDVTCVKSGGLDGGANNHAINVEFYNKDRLGYTQPVPGAEQKAEFA